MNFKQSPGTNLVTVTGTISGLPKGLHGFHVHENPDISDNCNNVGPHFNPTKVIIFFFVATALHFLLDLLFYNCISYLRLRRLISKVESVAKKEKE